MNDVLPHIVILINFISFTLASGIICIAVVTLFTYRNALVPYFNFTNRSMIYFSLYVFFLGLYFLGSSLFLLHQRIGLQKETNLTYLLFTIIVWEIIITCYLKFNPFKGHILFIIASWILGISFGITSLVKESTGQFPILHIIMGLKISALLLYFLAIIFLIFYFKQKTKNDLLKLYTTSIIIHIMYLVFFLIKIFSTVCNNFIPFHSGFAFLFPLWFSVYFSIIQGRFLIKPLFERDGEYVKKIMADLELSEKEIDIAYLLYCGEDTSSIATLCSISPSTVKFHTHNIYDKCNVSNKSELVHYISEFL